MTIFISILVAWFGMGVFAAILALYLLAVMELQRYIEEDSVQVLVGAFLLGPISLLIACVVWLGVKLEDGTIVNPFASPSKKEQARKEGKW